MLTVDCQPLILVLALWELHDLPQAAAAQRSFRILSQLVARRTLARARAELVPRALVSVDGFFVSQVICTV